MTGLRRFLERISDRVTAVIWAMQRSDRFCDPVENYGDELIARLASKSQRFYSKIAVAQQTLDREKKHLQQLYASEVVAFEKEIADLQAELKSQEEKLSEYKRQ